MADEFIDVLVETNEQTLADLSVARLQIEWPGYAPNEGDPEVVVIEALAPMAADAAETAARVPRAVFRTILEELHGIVFTDGTPATTTVTFALVDADAHLIPAGAEIDIDGYAFTVDDDTPTAALSVAGVPVTAAVDGLETNDLAGDSVQLITALSFVEGVTVDAITAGGSDPEDEDSYRNRGSRELELMARTLVTTRDYELMALSQPSVGRVVAISDPVAREVVVVASTPSGGVLPAPEKATLLALYEDHRQSNWEVALDDATTTLIDVTYSVHPYPGFNAADLIARIDATLELFLDPANWGRPREYGDISSTRWLLEPIVRHNKIIDLIGDVEGVDYVVDVQLAGSAGTLLGNGDWEMPGTVPLASGDTMAGSVA